MAMNIKAMAKEAGISENELKGLSLKDQIKLITKKMVEEHDSLEMEQAKNYIFNFEKKLPKLTELLHESFEIYVKSVGQKKSPTVVPVVGYNGSTKEVIVFQNEKLYPINEKDLIKSMEELSELINTKKPRGTVGGRKKKGT